MIIREIQLTDAEGFLHLSKEIDSESDYLLFEEGERQTTLAAQTTAIQEIMGQENSTIFVAEQDEQLIGYLLARGGRAKRNQHNLNIVIAIKNAYTGRGIGTRLFHTLEKWASDKGITRLELGLMSRNIPAFLLYKKMGFEIEGVRKNMFYVDGEFVDEYLMAKLLKS